MKTHTKNCMQLFGILETSSQLKVTLMKGERIVIPTSCRDSILADLHKSHEGANQSLSLARTCAYWPGMEADMMDYIKQCVTCIDNAKMPVETLCIHMKSQLDLG